MNYSLKNQRGLLTLLVFLTAKISFCQISSSLGLLNNSYEYLNSEIVLKKSNFSIEATASMLPKAKITREKGNYRLRSHLQSAYDIGINYLYSVNKSLLISSGFHFIVGKRNFFLNIPTEDISRY